MRVRYTPEAFADRERIIQYLRERSPLGARNVAASIRECLAQLRDQPQSGHSTEDSEVRVIFVARYPYKIFYRLNEAVIEIMHIRNTSRRENR
jgi:toxin ParE1/3/4